MSEIQIDVRPAHAWWRLRCDPLIEPMYFGSGGRAERAARELAIKLNGNGHTVRVMIHDRNEKLIATALYVPDAPGKTEPPKAKAGVPA